MSNTTSGSQEGHNNPPNVGNQASAPQAAANSPQLIMNNMFAVEPFRLEGTSSAQGPKWNLWVDRIELFFDAMEIAAERKRLFSIWWVRTCTV